MSQCFLTNNEKIQKNEVSGITIRVSGTNLNQLACSV